MDTIKSVKDYLEEAEYYLKEKPGFFSANELGLHYLKQARKLIEKGYPPDFNISPILHQMDYEERE